MEIKRIDAERVKVIYKNNIQTISKSAFLAEYPEKKVELQKLEADFLASEAKKAKEAKAQEANIKKPEAGLVEAK